MTNQLRRNLVLLGIVLMLGLAVYLTPQNPGDVLAIPLTSLDPNGVRRVEIERPGKPTTVAVRDGQGWRLEAPLQVAGSRSRLERIAQVTQTPSYGRYDLDPAERTRYGLARPAVTLNLDGTEVRFGDREPLQGRRYVETGGTLHVAENVLWQVDLAVTELISPRPFPPDSRLQSLTLAELNLSRNEAGGGR